MSARGVLRTVQGGYLLFHCPGCDGAHMVREASADKSGGWTFNGDYDRPTFKPSILVTYNGPDADKEGPPSICHSFVTDGQIQFLNDCTHRLAGQTVPLVAGEGA